MNLIFFIKKIILTIIYFFDLKKKKINSFKNVFNCKLVCSKSFIFLSNYFSLDLRSSSSFFIINKIQKIYSKKNTIYYVCNDALEDFVNNNLNKINYNFTLISGDSDRSIKKSILSVKKILNNKFLKKWYCQNNLIRSKKIISIPIGLDLISQFHDTHKIFFKTKNSLTPQLYESKIIQIIKKSPKFEKKFNQIFCNYHFSLNKFRHEAILEVDKNLCFFLDKRIDHERNLRLQCKFKFILCPEGNGIDTHRLWEGLILGNIPIIKSNPLNNLYKDLPVIIIKSWKNLDRKKLNSFSKSFANKKYNYEKLLFSYWKSMIEEKIPIKKSLKNYETFKKYITKGL